MGFYYVDFSCRLIEADSEEDAANKVYSEILERNVMPEICSVQEAPGETEEAEDYLDLDYLKKVNGNKPNTIPFGGDTGVDADFEVPR